MECPTCFLRYNVQNRTPLVLSCGHTLCALCIKKTKKCRTCGTSIVGDKNYAMNFSLMDILNRDSREIDKYIKVCFVGSTTTGKTTLIKRMMGNEFFQETVTTIGFDFSFQDRQVDGLQVRYQLWDSAGQEKFRAITPIHYKSADLVVIVYDVNQPDSENRVSYWIEEALKNCPEKVRLIVVGNKIDLTQENGKIKPIDDGGLKQILQQGYPHLLLSCKTGQGIEEFWETLDNQLRKIMSQKKQNIAKYQKQLEQIQKKKAKTTKLRRKDGENYNPRTVNVNTCC